MFVYLDVSSCIVWIGILDLVSSVEFSCRWCRASGATIKFAEGKACLGGSPTSQKVAVTPSGEVKTPVERFGEVTKKKTRIFAAHWVALRD